MLDNLWNYWTVTLHGWKAVFIELGHSLCIHTLQSALCGKSRGGVSLSFLLCAKPLKKKVQVYTAEFSIKTALSVGFMLKGTDNTHVIVLGSAAGIVVYFYMKWKNIHITEKY